MFRELSAAPDLKSPRDDVSLFSPARSQSFAAVRPPLSVALSASPSPAPSRRLPCPCSPLCPLNHLVPSWLPSCDESDSNFKKLHEPRARGPPPVVLGSWGISGWIRKLIKDGVPRSIDRRGESLFIIIDRYVYRWVVVSCSGSSETYGNNGFISR